jgi:hypothetical protein
MLVNQKVKADRIGKLLTVVLMCTSLTVFGDVVPTRVIELQQRHADNPKIYDRMDNYCKDKKPGMDCVIPGSTFSGGGKGSCRTEINRLNDTIDLACQRTGQVELDRKLPEGGFYYEPNLCKEHPGCVNDCPPTWYCTPQTEIPHDQFCQGNREGGSCTVELTYQNKIERHPGTCNVVEESEDFYYQGHNTAHRLVVRCEPPHLPERTYTPAKWYKKVLN